MGLGSISGGGLHISAVPQREQSEPLTVKVERLQVEKEDLLKASADFAKLSEEVQSLRAERDELLRRLQDPRYLALALWNVLKERFRLWLIRG